MATTKAKKKEMPSDLSLQPIGDRVLVKEMKNEMKKTESGIILPTPIEEDRGAKRGLVVAVGNGKFEDGKLVPPPVKKDDEILFQWGDEIKINGEDYFIVSGSNILGIIN